MFGNPQNPQVTKTDSGIMIGRHPTQEKTVIIASLVLIDAVLAAQLHAPVCGFGSLSYMAKTHLLVFNPVLLLLLDDTYTCIYIYQLGPTFFGTVSFHFLKVTLVLS